MFQTPDQFVSQLALSICPKDFSRSTTIPAKQPSESWSTWYLRFSLHGTLYGVFIPPWESIQLNYVYGSWFDTLPIRVQNAVQGPMSLLIKAHPV